jgi:two-component system, cell cycle response regulator
MTPTHLVALIGFTPFERSTLDAFFRLAGRRAPAYSFCPDPARAQLLLVDADSAEAMAHPLARSGRCVFIGAHGQPEQLGHMPRPLNMMALLRMLDACIGAAARMPAVPAPPRTAPAPVAAPAASVPVASAPAAPKVAPLLPRQFKAPQVPPPAPAQAMAARDHILVVDDSDIALRFMANCLGRFGFDVHLARSGEEALSRVADSNFDFVFMDVTMAGIDGYQTCKLIKKRPYPDGRRPPSVIMLTSRGGMVDKMRGTLSGCDAYLTKPLQQDALMKVIGERIVTSTTYVDTTRDPERAV